MAEIAGALMVPGMALAKVSKYLPYVGKIKDGQWFQNLIKRMALGGTAGAIDMGLYGYGTATGDWDSPERIEAAKTGAGVGLGIGMAGGPLTGIIDAGAKAISNKMGKKGMSAVDIDGDVLHEGYPAKTDRESVQFINDELARGYESFNDLRRMLDKMAELDPDIADIAQIADLSKPGSNLRALHQKIGQTSPTGRISTLQALENKAARFGGIAKKAIKKFLGKRIGDVERWKDIFIERTQELAAPLYKEADSTMVHSSDLWNEINTLMKRKDEVGKMVREAYSGVRMDIPSLNELTGLKGNLPSKGLTGEVPINWLHALKLYVKQQFDKMPKPDRKGAKPFAEIDAGKLKNIMGKINNFLKGESEPYRGAAKIWSSRSEYLEAFDAGVKASEKGGKHTADVVRRELSEMSEPSRHAYRLGYASKMYQRVTSANVPSPNEEKILKLFEEEERDKLMVLYKSPGLAKDFLEKMKHISDMDYRTKRMLSGSQTDQMREIGKRLEGEPGLVSKAMDTYNKVKRGPAGMPMDARNQNRISGMGPYMDAQGTTRVSEAINRMEEERRRAQVQAEARSMYPWMFPSILAPQEEVRESNPFGLLGDIP